VSELVPVPPGEVAGLGRRLAALALDWLVAIGVSLLVFRDVAYGSLESSVAILLLFAAELILLTWLTGSSFGQRIVGLQVVRMDGTRLGLGQVSLRTVLICLVVPAVVIDSYGRGLHDRAVDSVVVRAGSVG
jgi:uncharacterized RDD family membrane protein YckC